MQIYNQEGVQAHYSIRGRSRSHTVGAFFVGAALAAKLLLAGKTARGLTVGPPDYAFGNPDYSFG